MFLCFQTLHTYFFLTDTFSSVASFYLSNDLVGCIYLSNGEVFISTDHQSWVPAHADGEQTVTKLRPAAVGSSSRGSSGPACDKQLHWGKPNRPSNNVSDRAQHSGVFLHLHSIKERARNNNFPSGIWDPTHGL